MTGESIVGVEVTEVLCARCAERRSPLSTAEVEHLTLRTAENVACDSCGHRLDKPDLRPEAPLLGWNRCARGGLADA